MKRIKHFLYLLCCSFILISCKSNGLKQENAENTIRQFLSTNIIETSEVIINHETIKRFGKTNVFTQFHTSVKVYFNTKGGAEVKLLFIFKRTPKNKWFLTSVEQLEEPIQGLEAWISSNQKIKIAAQ